MDIKDYRDVAKANEQIFRALLKDLKERNKLNLDAELPIERIFAVCSSGNRNDLFTILNFQRPDADTAIISFEHIDYNSRGGSGMEIRYKIKNDNSIEYEKDLIDWKLKL